MNRETDPALLVIWPSEALTLDAPTLTPSGWLRWFERWEASAGLSATLLLGFFPAVPFAVGAILMLNGGSPLLAAAFASGALLAAGLAVLVAAVAGQAVRACFPEWSDNPADNLRLKPDHCAHGCPARSFAVELALSMPEMPGPLRPLLCLWWLMHYAGCTLASLAVHALIGVSLPETACGVLFAALAHFAFLLGSNVYLVLAASMLFDSEATLEGVWSLRFLFDLVLTLIVLLYCL